MGSESKNGVGVLQLPQGTKKVIQNLKEIVNCSESEIYAALKECNMDPNEAVQRLLSLDSFHEVKSKRERRKEMKETQETRFRVNGSGSTRVLRSSSERNVGRSGSTQANYNEFGNVAYKGENGLVAPPPYPSTHVTGKTLNQQPSSHSDSLNTDGRRQAISTGDFVSASVQHSSGCQPAWLGMSTGHLSMADIVRMGRPLYNKGSHSSSETSYVHEDGVAPNSCHYYAKPSQVPAPFQPELHLDLDSQNPSNVPEMICQSGVTAYQNASVDEWPVVEQLTAAHGSSAVEASAASASGMYSNESNIYGNGSHLSWNHQSDDGQVSEGDYTRKKLGSDCINSVSASSSSEHKFVGHAAEASHCDEDLVKDSSSSDSHVPTYKCEEASGSGSGSNVSKKNNSVCSTENVIVDVSSAAENLQNLSLGKGELDDNFSVVLPDHLQALAADCSHLSFGTYKSRVSSALTRSLPSNQFEDDFEGASTAMDGLTRGHLNTRHRNLGYNGDGTIASLYESHRAPADAGNLDLSAPLQPELMKRDIPEATLGHEYIKSSLNDSQFGNVEQASSGLSFARTEMKTGNFPFQAEPPYSDSVSSDLLVPTIQSLRVSDNLHSQFPVTQSMPSRYNNALSPRSSSTISLSEVLKSGTLSLSEPSSVLPQHRTNQSYSQSSLPLEQRANIIGCPAPSQSYMHLPSTFQQAYPGGMELYQSLDDMKYNLSQYNKSGASMGRLPSASAGYGSFVNSTNLPGSYLNSPAAASIITKGGYNDVLHPQYKDGSHFTSLQQNISSSTWNAGLRTQMPVSESAYYSLLGQNQQHAGHQQVHQSGLHYGSLGYSDLYHSQTGITHGRQQQSLSDLTLGHSEDLSAQQLHQFWQQTY
ncbi:uncharacterized protein LOC107416203 isoform X1 [Ziziphus jujuba]|uniref:Uncharacterized protein LOC107416203 isoform X1 n=2 Tax=Ziziphus jujuba TaxID=326968 RepID=A0A6P4A2M7_ZIZJJ|nr:uncharacterized protein LOC107416203 isoform X1 [Ziziphus jujuba]